MLPLPLNQIIFNKKNALWTINHMKIFIFTLNFALPCFVYKIMGTLLRSSPAYYLYPIRKTISLPLTNTVLFLHFWWWLLQQTIKNSISNISPSCGSHMLVGLIPPLSLCYPLPSPLHSRTPPPLHLTAAVRANHGNGNGLMAGHGWAQRGGGGECGSR